MIRLLEAANPHDNDDGDLLTVAQEFTAGLDPTVPDGTALSLDRSLRRVVFTVPAAAGAGYEGRTRFYRLHFSPDLADWSTVVDESVATGETNSVPVALEPAAGSYRLDVRLE